MKYCPIYNALTRNGLINVTCTDRRLALNGSYINFQNDITGVSIGSNIVFVLFDSRDEGITHEELLRNNVNAYDFNGNFLWSIGDVIDETRSFERMSIHNASSLAKHDTSCQPVLIKDEHEYLVLYTYGDQRFVIDVTEKKQIQKKGGFR